MLQTYFLMILVLMISMVIFGQQFGRLFIALLFDLSVSKVDQNVTIQKVEVSQAFYLFNSGTLFGIFIQLYMQSYQLTFIPMNPNVLYTCVYLCFNHSSFVVYFTVLLYVLVYYSYKMVITSRIQNIGCVQDSLNYRQNNVSCNKNSPSNQQNVQNSKNVIEKEILMRLFNRDQIWVIQDESANNDVANAPPNKKDADQSSPEFESGNTDLRSVAIVNEILRHFSHEIQKTPIQ